MNCPHCGNPISPTDRFCSTCGEDLIAGETLISRVPLSIQPPPPSPAYEIPSAPSDSPAAPPPAGGMGGRNVVLIVAVALILLCCCCLLTILAAYMLLGEGILSQVLHQTSLVSSLV